MRHVPLASSEISFSVCPRATSVSELMAVRVRDNVQMFTGGPAAERRFCVGSRYVSCSMLLNDELRLT